MALKKKSDIVKTVGMPLTIDKSMSNYFQSKCQEKYHKSFFVNQFHKERGPKFAKVVDKQKLRATNRLLHQRKTEATQKRKHLDQQWAEIEVIQTQLKENFETFNIFFRENSEKRERAGNKLKEDEKMSRERRKNIEKMEVKYAKLKNMKRQFQERLCAYQFYEDFLDEVMRLAPEFRDNCDIIARFDSLTLARMECLEKDQRLLKALDNIRVEMSKLTEEKEIILLGLRSRVSMLNTRYELAHESALIEENSVIACVTNIFTTSTRLRLIANGAGQLYKQICMRKREHYDPNMTLENKLLNIKQTLAQIHHMMVYKLDAVPLIAQSGAGVPPSDDNDWRVRNELDRSDDVKRFLRLQKRKEELALALNKAQWRKRKRSASTGSIPYDDRDSSRASRSLGRDYVDL